jgi:hypothetical protein
MLKITTQYIYVAMHGVMLSFIHKIKNKSEQRPSNGPKLLGEFIWNLAVQTYT